MFKSKSSRFNKRVRPSTAKCYFCENKLAPEYKDITIITKYTSERGKLISATQTGICSKHQRILTREIKRARHMAMLPFVVRA